MNKWLSLAVDMKVNLTEISVKTGKKTDLRTKQNPFTVSKLTGGGISFVDKDKKIFAATYEYLQSMTFELVK